jgi:hypothetical protein
MYAARDATLQAGLYAGARFRLAVCRRAMRASVKREVVVDVKRKSGWWERCILGRKDVLKAGCQASQLTRHIAMRVILAVRKSLM